MKKKTILTVAIILLVVVLVISAIAGSYNSLIKAQTELEQSSAEISTQIQRRADLIPNFVSTVKGYSDYEQSTYTAVTEARSALKNASSPEDMATANERLDGAISVWVTAVTEAYPDLENNQNYTALLDELGGTENRIAKARNSYNEKVKEYNFSVRKFPKNIIASIFGFDSAEYFEADTGAEKVPEVSF